MRNKAMVAAAMAALLTATRILAQSSQQYAVVSVKPSGHAVPWFGDRMQPDGDVIRNLTLKRLIVLAYGLIDTENADVVLGGPKWAATAKFDIDAKLEPGDVAAFRALNNVTQMEVRRTMLIALLADRFHLKAHREQRDFPVYGLRVAKGGLKLKSYVEGDYEPGGGGPGTMGAANGGINGTAVPMERILLLLNNRNLQLDRVVIDQTHATGLYNFVIHWAPLGSDENSSLPGIFTSLEEQAGLHLEKTMAPLDVIVIDSAAEPQPD